MTALLPSPTRTLIRLEAHCAYPTCAEYACEMHDLLAVPRYSEGASIMAVPASRAEWEAEHRTARKRAWRAERLGYTFAEVDYSQHSDGIYEINVSLGMRQGRPMSPGYTERRNRGALSDAQTRCERHRTSTYGVLSGRTLVAYLTLHRRGELALVSMILGHGDHLRAGIMFQLWAGLVEAQAGQSGVFFYNRHDSGRREGLAWFKERLGFRPADLEWSL